MVSRSGAASRIAYGTLFVVGVPALLVAWARALESVVRLPPVGSPSVGGAIAAAGLALLAAGMAGLAVHGGGLPMNAFPPPRYVRRGVYRAVRDPIYLGFGLAVLGVSLATRSPAGLWLVTPVTWLAMAALVAGHERHDLRRRFPGEATEPTALSLPGPGAHTPGGSERLATLLWVMGSWLVAYFAVQGLGRPPGAFTTQLPGEGTWPVFQWMEVPYVSAYLVVPLAVLGARTRGALRSFALSGLTATAFITLIWLVVPVVASRRPFDPTSWMGQLLAAEQAHSHGVAAFPAFHVLWPMLAARAWATDRSRFVGLVAWTWALLVGVSCLGTGHHTAVEVAAGAGLYLPLRDVERTWRSVLRGAERVANSWREWRIGPLRFINHGLYAGAAGAVGILVAGSAAGPGTELTVAWVAGWALVGAGAYAQVLEGSGRLLRPFGWYGGVLGGLVGVLSSPVLGGNVPALLGAFALAAPWIQSVGRLRCLVQGCCHGSPVASGGGIRYRHPRSRVCHLADLRGVPLHPTPVYSILADVVIGMLLLRLRYLGAPDLLLLGACLILTGCARFVEESYRGEPQTPWVGGLRLYQWFAVATLLAGVGVTFLPSAPGPRGLALPSPGSLAWSLVFFVLGAAAMGMDFPGSNRRFSRLASGDRPAEPAH